LPLLAVAWAGTRATWFTAVAIVAAASTRPQGGGLTRNLGFSPLAVAGLVVAGGLAWWWWSRRAGPSRLRTGDVVAPEG
jgi:hypothetical protein